MAQETRQIIGPFPSRMENKCTHCTFKIHRFSQIYFYKQRRTQEEIDNGVAIKGAIAVHVSCGDSFFASQLAQGIKWEIKAPNGQREQDEPMVTPATQSEVPVTPSSNTPANNGDLLSIIAASVLPLVQSQLKTKVDTSEVQSMIDKAIESIKWPVKRIEIFNPTTNETKDLGIQHKQFPDLLRMVNARMRGRNGEQGNRLNVWVSGSAGTGKTSAAEAVANALGLEFAFTGSLSEEYKVLGFVSPATGQAILTAFLRVWEHGGVFCFDDFDGSDPIAALGLNGPLAGSWCQFPDGRMVKRHIDCVLILTANTWGHGATSEYVGRLKQDAAFLDRFVKLQWEIDEQLELVTSGNETWCKRVQQVRSKVKAQGLKVLVTPRATYYGVALLDAGMTQTQVEHAVLAASMTPDQWKAVR